MEHAKLVAQVDKMVASGRMTEEEAETLRAATTSEEFDRAMGAVRARHAGAHIARAVAAGDMSRAEGDDNLERLRNGEHPQGLRARLSGFKREAAGREGPDT